VVAVQGWSGEARTAFTELYDECMTQATSLLREVGAFHVDAVSVSGEVVGVHDQLQLAGWAGRAVEVGFAVDAVQAGLDPLTDLATAVAQGGARVALRGIAAGLERAVLRSVTMVASRRAALAAVRRFAGCTAPRVQAALAADLAVSALLGLDVDPRGAAESTAIAAVLPGGLGLTERAAAHRIAAMFPRGLNLRAHEGEGLGHGASRHVVRKAQELAARLDREPRTRASSGFVGQQSARRAVVAALGADLDEIEAWYASGGRLRAFESSLPRGCVTAGYSRASPGGAVTRVDPAQLTNVRIVLMRQGDEVIIRSASPSPGKAWLTEHTVSDQHEHEAILNYTTFAHGQDAEQLMEEVDPDQRLRMWARDNPAFAATASRLLTAWRTWDVDDAWLAEFVVSNDVNDWRLTPFTIRQWLGDQAAIINDELKRARP